MSNILMGPDEPDDGWEDFLSQPMSSLIGQSDTQLGENAPAGFRDRYSLAMSFVYLLSVTLVVGLGLFALSQRGDADNLEVGDSGETPTSVVVDSTTTTVAPSTTAPVSTTEAPVDANVVPALDRYEFVVQTDDPEGLFWYVLDHQEMTRLWAAECLDQLGEPDREIVWAELSTFDEPEVFTECGQLVPLIRSR